MSLFFFSENLRRINLIPLPHESYSTIWKWLSFSPNSSFFQMERSFNHYNMIWLLRPIIMLDGFQFVRVSPKRGSQIWMYYLKCGLIMQNTSVLQLLRTLFQVIYRGRKCTPKRGWHPDHILGSWTFTKPKCLSFADRTRLNQIS